MHPEEKFMLIYNAGWAAVSISLFVLPAPEPFWLFLAFYFCWYRGFFRQIRKE
jgi:hypothetical protein